METLHTATPWHAGKNNLAVNFRFITDNDGEIVAYCEMPKETAKANAAFIVRACNAHDDLLDALYSALPYVEDAEDLPDFKKGVVRKHINAIRAALAKAEK